MTAVSELDVSVLVATARPPALLASLLADLGRLESGVLTWEVLLLVNGPASSRVQDDPEMGWRRGNPSLRVFALRQPGKSEALNHGIASARGQLLLFTDDDVLLDRRWLLAHWNAYQRWGDRALLGGRIVPRFPSSSPSWITDNRCVPQSPNFSRYDFGPAECIVTTPPFGPNMAVGRRLIGEARFNPMLGPGGRLGLPMGEEVEFASRIADRCKSRPLYVYVPYAKVEHVVRPEQVGRGWLVQRARTHGLSEAFLATMGAATYLSDAVTTPQVWRRTWRCWTAHWRALGFAPFSERAAMRYAWKAAHRRAFLAGLRKFSDRRRTCPAGLGSIDAGSGG